MGPTRIFPGGCQPAVDWSLSRGYVTGPIALASWPTLTALWHLTVFQLMGARPRLIIRLGHPLDLSEKSPRLEARTPRESRNHRLLTANPRVDRNNPDPARGDAKARAAREAGRGSAARPCRWAGERGGTKCHHVVVPKTQDRPDDPPTDEPADEQSEAEEPEKRQR